MVKNTKKTMAQMICSALLSVAKRFLKYCGKVMESFAATEKLRNLFATKIQLSAVPSARPIPIHTLPMPNAKILPGKPIKSQPLISDACALIAVTHGPILRPPIKYSFSPFCPFMNTKPTESMPTKYTMKAARIDHFIVFSPSWLFYQLY